jgi:uncharacterized membrane protein YdfJ with MMPL/SSD domain
VRRLRATAYAALVTIVAFYLLAVPTLQELYGPVAVLPAYAAVALLAGVATYHAVTYVSAFEFAGNDQGALEDRPRADEVQEGEDVDEMLQEMEADRGE